jgi:hypothetical protein
MHATSDGALTSVEPFAEALGKADAVLEADAPFHIHFSDIQFANRNETKHLPYGEGTLRAEPLAEALARLRAAGDRDLESPTRSRLRRSALFWGPEAQLAARGSIRRIGSSTWASSTGSSTRRRTRCRTSSRRR